MKYFAPGHESFSVYPIERAELGFVGEPLMCDPFTLQNLWQRGQGIVQSGECRMVQVIDLVSRLAMNQPALKNRQRQVDGLLKFRESHALRKEPRRVFLESLVHNRGIVVRRRRHHDYAGRVRRRTEGDRRLARE